MPNEPWKRYHPQLEALNGDGDYHLSELQRDTLCYGNNADVLHWHTGSIRVADLRLINGQIISPSGVVEAQGHGLLRTLKTDPSQKITLNPNTVAGFPYASYSASGYSIWALGSTDLVFSPILRLGSRIDDYNANVANYDDPINTDTLPIDPSYYVNNQPVAWLYNRRVIHVNQIVSADADTLTFANPLPASTQGLFLFTPPPIAGVSGEFGIYCGSIYYDGSDFFPKGYIGHGDLTFSCYQDLTYVSSSRDVTVTLTNLLPPSAALVRLLAWSSRYTLIAATYLDPDNPEDFLDLVNIYGSITSYGDTNNMYAAGSLLGVVTQDEDLNPCLHFYLSSRTTATATFFKEAF